MRSAFSVLVVLAAARGIPPEPAQLIVEPPRQGSVAPATAGSPIRSLRPTPAASSRDTSLGSDPSLPYFIYYGTDRAPTGDPAPDLFYGSEPGALSVGVARVSVPTDLNMRRVAANPKPVARPGAGPPVHPDVTLDRVQPLTETVWLPRLRQQLAADSSGTILVFVPGFGATFDQVVRRAATLAYDLSFPGAIVVYSWPSQGDASPAAYARDGAAIEGSEAPLAGFLKTVATRTGARKVNIVAHSIGTLLLARALRDIATDAPGVRFNQVVLMAPDIDTTSFRRTLAGPLRAVADRVTIYVSRNDEALAWARRATGQPRVGEAPDGQVVMPGFDVVDASAVRGTELGSPTGNARQAVLTDLQQVLQGQPSTARRLIPRAWGPLIYYELKSGPP